MPVWYTGTSLVGLKSYRHFFLADCHTGMHRRIAGGAWGCCSTPKLSEKSEIFRLSEILGCLSEIFGCLSEIFITYLYKNALFIIAKMFLLFFRST